MTFTKCVGVCVQFGEVCNLPCALLIEQGTSFELGLLLIVVEVFSFRFINGSRLYDRIKKMQFFFQMHST